VFARNTIPLPASVVPTLKYNVRNIARVLVFSSFFNMSPIAHRKRKECLALAFRIEKTNREAKTYSYYRIYFRCCFMDKAESWCYLEYIRLKSSCDSLGYKIPIVPRKVVYRFFCGLICCPIPTSPFSIPWFLVFELDAFLNSMSPLL
jgi:hypothetical protein